MMVFSFPSIKTLSYPLLSELHWKSVLPHRTLAGHYIASYSTRLTDNDPLIWHEWGNIAGLARHGMTGGFVLHPMAVDNPTALQGGREIWGLNKMMGTINCLALPNEGRFQLVTNHSIVDLYWREIGPRFPWTSHSQFLTCIEGIWHTYKVVLKGRHRICRVKVLQETTGDFSALQPGKYWGVRFTRAEIEITAPVPIK